MIWCWIFCRNNNYFVPNLLYVSDLIEYICVFLRIFSDNILVSAGCNNGDPVAFIVSC